jgi:catechol 2,3-dioxygenase-like lactoylglutathione lyase family enzyme
VSALEPIAGRPPDQVGILVPDLDEALERYSRLWGLGGWRGFHYDADTLPTSSYRGEPGRYRVTIAISDTKPQIELLLPEAGPSIYHEWLETRSHGLHHLGFWVESAAAASAQMEAAGYTVTQAGAGYGLDGDGGYAYLDTERDLGVVLELIEVPARRRTPDFTYP